MGQITSRMGEEAKAGLQKFAAALTKAGLALVQVYDYRDRRASEVTAGTDVEAVSFSLTWEALAHLAESSEDEASANEFAETLSRRIAAGHSTKFYCSSGVPVRIDLEWPIQANPLRAAAYIRSEVRDLRSPDNLAYCAVVITHQEEIFDIRKNPFKRYELIVNAIRSAVDEGRITFYQPAAHPDTLQEIRLRIPRDPHPPLQLEQLQSYIAGKVFWLGFRNGGRKARVWVSDPWDASYLHTNSAMLTRAAEILDAKEQIVLDDSETFGTVGRKLLANSEHFDEGPMKGGASRANEIKFDWDLFISHASEDKESFVRELAEELRRRGLRVWYDEFTLRLGDSLRRSIDHGLAHSRFGIVVLSHAFFEKHWPQRELDGLAALESGSRKVILPIWHDISKEEIARYSPTLADKVGVKTTLGIENVVKSIVEAM